MPSGHWQCKCGSKTSMQYLKRWSCGTHWKQAHKETDLSKTQPKQAKAKVRPPVAHPWSGADGAKAQSDQADQTLFDLLPDLGSSFAASSSESLVVKLIGGIQDVQALVQQIQARCAQTGEQLPLHVQQLLQENWMPHMLCFTVMPTRSRNSRRKSKRVPKTCKRQKSVGRPC